MKKLSVECFGANLKFVRQNKKLTHEAFAEKLDVSVRVIYDWENGIKYPTFPRAVEIANVLDVSLDDILQLL